MHYNYDLIFDLIAIDDTAEVLLPMFGKSDAVLDIVSSSSDNDQIWPSKDNRDGDFDLMVGSASIMHVFQGNSTPSYSASVTYNAASPTSINNFCIAGLNRDSSRLPTPLSGRELYRKERVISLFLN